MIEQELQEIEKLMEWGIKVCGDGQGYTNLDDEVVFKLIEKVKRLNKELEQHKLRETYLLARLKKAEG